MRAVEVRGDYGHEIRRRDRVTQQVGDRVTAASLNHVSEERRDAIEFRLLFFIDELNLAMLSHCAPQVSARQLFAVGCLATRGAERNANSALSEMPPSGERNTAANAISSVVLSRNRNS